MSVLSEIPDFYPIEFTSNWKRLAGQYEARLRESVTVDSNVQGKQRKYNYMDEVEMSLITTRGGDTELSDVDLSARWLRQLPYDVANGIDEFDENYLGTVVLPDSPLVQRHATAYGKLLDDTVISVALGTAYSGIDGTTANTFAAGQIVPVNYVKGVGASGNNTQITLDKIIYAKGLFGKNEVDSMDPITIYVNQQALDVLLFNTQVTSADYASVKALATGDFASQRFMGMTWVRTERLPIASNIRSIIMLAKSGVVIAPGAKETMMDILPQKRHMLQIRSKCLMGGVRLEEKKVVKILCDETAVVS